MKLYELVGRDRTNGFSPFVWRIKLALAHKGIAFETVPLHFTNIKEVLKFADAKTVPILQDGENIITDSWDIACYLEDKYPKGPSLFGCDIGKSYAHLMHWQVTKTLLMPLFKVLVSDIYDVIDDKAYDLFFHLNSKHNYSFGDRHFQNGAICVRKAAKKEGENGEKVTASRLMPIQTASAFEKHVKEVSEAVCKRGSTNKITKKVQKRVVYYKVELCTIILKEKIQKPSLPAESITTSSITTSEISDANTPLIFH